MKGEPKFRDKDERKGGYTCKEKLQNIIRVIPKEGEMVEESRMRVRERARSHEIERERETEEGKRRQIGCEIEI